MRTKTDETARLQCPLKYAENITLHNPARGDTFVPEIKNRINRIQVSSHPHENSIKEILFWGVQKFNRRKIKRTATEKKSPCYP